MAELGPTTIFGDLTTHGSLGGAVRIAYCIADAGAQTTIECMLDEDPSAGDVVTVQCLTPGGTSYLNQVVPRLSDGDPMLVINHNDTWYSATIFEDSQDFDEGIAMPKLKYISGYVVTDSSAAPESLSDTTWAISKAIIKAIKVQTDSTDWDLTLWTNSEATDHGLYDNGYIDLVKSASGGQVILLDLPYIDYDNSNEVHLQFLDQSGSVNATVDVYGVEART